MATLLNICIYLFSALQKVMKKIKSKSDQKSSVKKMSAARKHTSLNIKQKLNVISDYKKYNRQATINRILKNKTLLIEKSKTFNGSTKFLVAS